MSLERESSEREKVPEKGENGLGGNLKFLHPPDPDPGQKLAGSQLEVSRISYAAAATQSRGPPFPSIDLPKRQPFNKEGKPAVMFTPAEIGACSRQLEHALIAKFSNGRPHVSQVEKEFKQVWKTEGNMTVSDLDSRHILVILESEKDAIVALTQAPRRVGTSLFRLFKWSLEFHRRKESTVITIWVHFLNLRPDLFNEGVLKCLCQPFGRFLDSDSNTKNRARCAFARCCVEIDLAKPLPKEIWIDLGDGNGWWQEVIYEGNLKYCNKCRIHGHTLEECRKVAKTHQIREGDQKEQSKPDLGINRSRDIQKKEEKQEWIQVKKKKSKASNGSELLPIDLENSQEKEELSKVPTLYVVEQEEKLEEQRNEEQTNVSQRNGGKESQIKKQITKSYSASNLSEKGGKENQKSKETLLRSNSLSNLPVNCKDSRLEYLAEEFHHFHLISKHLKKVKEETQKRMKMQEEIRRQVNYQEDIQNYFYSLTQEDGGSKESETQNTIVKETQTQEDQRIPGDLKQKKQKNAQSGNKPMTRASKKHASPKKC